MKTLEFKRDSWHYKLANNADGFCGCADFCQYIRFVIIGLAK